MPLYTCQVPAEARARSAGPTSAALVCREPEQLTLFTADQDATHEGRRATPEEIDQVFGAQLATHPRSVFLREVVADRARRRLTGEGLEDAGMDALLSTFVERVRPDQRGDARYGGGGDTAADGARSGLVGPRLIAGGHGRRITGTGAAGIAAPSRSQEAT